MTSREIKKARRRLDDAGAAFRVALRAYTQAWYELSELEREAVSETPDNTKEQEQ